MGANSVGTGALHCEVVGSSLTCSVLQCPVTPSSTDICYLQLAALDSFPCRMGRGGVTPRCMWPDPNWISRFFFTIWVTWTDHLVYLASGLLRNGRKLPQMPIDWTLKGSCRDMFTGWNTGKPRRLLVGTWFPNPEACIEGLWAGSLRAILGKTLKRPRFKSQ